MDFEKIKNTLPHRFPFLLVDRVLEINNTSIKALKNISANEPFFPGHFPEYALMPGVLQIEALAQAAGLILAHRSNFDKETHGAFLAGVDKAKFKRLVTPGDQLILEATLSISKAGIHKFEAKASVDGERASSACIILAVRPR